MGLLCSSFGIQVNMGLATSNDGVFMGLQKSLPDGKNYCERKINFLKENHDKLVEVGL